jgi:deoxyribonuclease II/SH3 domain-containing protein
MIFFNRRGQLVLATVFAFCVVVLSGVGAEGTTITPRDTVTTNVVVRQEPSADSAKVGTLAPGETAGTLESVPNWQKVRLANCKVGYVSKRWVTETEGLPPSGDCTEPTPATGAGPVPLSAAGHPVDWWFVFKLNAVKFPECGPGATRACPSGGQVQNYASAFGQQYVYATSEDPELKKGAGCVGDTDADPVGATFLEAYNGTFHYVVWNDQFYSDPKIAGCGDSCSKPWGHSKGMVTWNDAGEGFVMQVTTPSWPASGSRTTPRHSDGNALGCTHNNNVKFSQHFFALRVNHDDLVHVLKGLQNASVATDRNNPQIVNNGGSQDIQDLVKTLGTKSQNTVPTKVTLSSGVQLISKPSSLHVPPWQMVSALLGGAPLRVASWWTSSKIYSTTTTTSIGCWDSSLGTAGPVEIATSGQWKDGTPFSLKGGPAGDGNHAKIGVSKGGSHHYAIFGDMNQEGAVSGNTSVCGGSQNGRGGLFFVIDNATLATSVADLMHGDTAPTVNSP